MVPMAFIEAGITVYGEIVKAECPQLQDGLSVLIPQLVGAGVDRTSLTQCTKFALGTCFHPTDTRMIPQRAQTMGINPSALPPENHWRSARPRPTRN